VEKDLPPKKEYLLYAPLTQLQKDIYQAIVKRDIRKLLITMKAGDAMPEEVGDRDPIIVEEATENGRKVRRKKSINYSIEENDSKWLRQLEKEANKKPEPPKAKTKTEIAQEKYKQAVKTVNNMKLQNLVMQLRKISSHPFLFDWPVDPETGDYEVNEDLINASGKMLLLNRLLDALFARKHKVLIFSQFTTMLDVIEDWAKVYKGFNVCRIDGNTSQEDRRSQMEEFNKGGDRKGAPNLFLLSTRAGGLGINLVAADTVIFFDNDWSEFRKGDYG
jgi:ATP-dependent DNA helicase